MPKLPDGWLDMENVGTPVGPFLPIKVPLDAKYDSSFQQHPSRRHDIQRIIRDLEASTTSANASAVFDLTNTNKYYDRDLVTMLGVEHVKFMGVAGHGALPSEGHVRSFIKHTKRVLAKSPDSTIITHCTHGHNRTGYMICSYLIREMRMGAQEAIRLFAEARPPGIYKAFYIDALCYQTGCFDDAALHITYPPETKMHDDETRGMGVFSSGKLDEGCLARQTPAFDYALGNVFNDAEDEAKCVTLTPAIPLWMTGGRIALKSTFAAKLLGAALLLLLAVRYPRARVKLAALLSLASFFFFAHQAKVRTVPHRHSKSADKTQQRNRRRRDKKPRG